MKTFRLFSMAALALVMAACSSNDDVIQQQTAQPQGKMHFTATIEAPNADATTRTTYTESGTTINVAWRAKEDGVYEGDKIALVYNGVKVIATVTAVDPVTQAATIEAFFTGSPSDGDDVWLAYPADAVASATPSGTFPFTPDPTCWDKALAQDGTLEFIQNNIDFRMGSGKLAVSGSDVTLKGSVSVSSLICIWKLTLQDNAATPNALNATKLTFKNNTFTQAEATSAAKSDYYLCVVPSFIPDASGTFSFEATVGSDTYTFSKTGLNLTAGKYYQSTLTMAKQLTYPIALSAATSDYVGSVVTTDGNVYATVAAASAASKTAVAVIAYVGSAGSVDASSASYKGLAIALSDANSANDCYWCWEELDFAAQVDLSCVSKYNNIADAIGHKDGISNTNALTTDSHTHAAATAATSNNGTAAPTGTSGWFLPSMGQWNLIVQGLATKQAGSAVTTNISTSNNSTYASSNLNSVITDAGGTGFRSSDYHSSTLRSDRYAWVMRFGGGNANDYHCFTSTSYVRSIIAF